MDIIVTVPDQATLDLLTTVATAKGHVNATAMVQEVLDSIVLRAQSAAGLVAPMPVRIANVELALATTQRTLISNTAAIAQIEANLPNAAKP